MSNEELQHLAEELARLDREKDSARAAAIENQIVEYELSRLKQFNGKAYFPLLKTNNGCIPFDDFCGILFDVLMELFRKYNPDRATFTTALTYIINLRVISHIKENMSSDDEQDEEWDTDQARERRPISLDKALAANTISLMELGFVDFPEDAEEDYKTEMRSFVHLAPVISDQKEADKHRTKKMWFERFFTFDVVKIIKNHYDCAEEAVKANAVLFCLMEIVLLEYLMVGAFSHMRDVVNNTIRNIGMLDKRNEAIQKCYSVSKPTVCERNQAYYIIFKEAMIE
jgi:hypothetical protein